jgi:hypothetical protein
MISDKNDGKLGLTHSVGEVSEVELVEFVLIHAVL